MCWTGTSYSALPDKLSLIFSSSSAMSSEVLTRSSKLHGFRLSIYKISQSQLYKHLLEPNHYLQSIGTSYVALASECMGGFGTQNKVTLFFPWVPTGMPSVRRMLSKILPETKKLCTSTCDIIAPKLVSALMISCVFPSHGFKCRLPTPLSTQEPSFW